MLKLFPLTALVLGLSSGVALADRHGDHRGVAVEHRTAPTVVRDHREFHNNAIVARDRGYYRGDGRVIGDRGYYRGDGRVVGDRGYYRGDGRVIVGGPGYRHFDRRPIYVSRPIIRERYFDYYRRPALIVENYNTMPGYYWVAGGWVWNGAEWIWQPGHYQPDPNYVDQGYDDSY